MPRLPNLTPDELTLRQKRLSAEIASTRGGAVLGPFAAWLRLPNIADKANALDNELRLHGTLDKRLFEVAVLVAARAWTAQYEWYAHEQTARAAGVEQDVIEAIRTGATPPFTNNDEQIVYRVASELSRQQRLSDEAYHAAELVFGINQLIELATVIGFYTMVAVVITAFECPVPGDAQPLAPSH